MAVRKGHFGCLGELPLKINRHDSSLSTLVEVSFPPPFCLRLAYSYSYAYAYAYVVDLQ